jgi:hypothetical protein
VLVVVVGAGVELVVGAGVELVVGAGVELVVGAGVELVVGRGVVLVVGDLVVVVTGAVVVVVPIGMQPEVALSMVKEKAPEAFEMVPITADVPAVKLTVPATLIPPPEPLIDVPETAPDTTIVGSAENSTLRVNVPSPGNVIVIQAPDKLGTLVSTPAFAGPMKKSSTLEEPGKLSWSILEIGLIVTLPANTPITGADVCAWPGKITALTTGLTQLPAVAAPKVRPLPANIFLTALRL